MQISELRACGRSKRPEQVIPHRGNENRATQQQGTFCGNLADDSMGAA